MEETKFAFKTNRVINKELVANDCPINGLTRLLILKSIENGKIEAVIMKLIAENKLAADEISVNNYNYKSQTFSGQILFISLNNRFINGWKYKDGKVVGEIKLRKTLYDNTAVQIIKNSDKKNSLTNVLTNRPEPTEPPIEGDGGGTCGTTYTDWYQRSCFTSSGETTCTDWTYTGTTQTTTNCNITFNTSGGYTSYPDGSNFESLTIPIGVNTIGSTFNPNMLFNYNGVKPIAESPSICQGTQDIWNLSISSNPSKEVMALVTSDNKFITVATLGTSGGSWGGLYSYNGQVYYTYPSSQGAPSQTYAGMIQSAGQYFIPIKATVHTHNPCLTDGTDGVTGFTLSTGDYNLSHDARFSNINHYVIGCGVIGKYDQNNNFATVVSTGTLSITCSVIQ